MTPYPDKTAWHLDMAKEYQLQSARHNYVARLYLDAASGWSHGADIKRATYFQNEASKEHRLMTIHLKAAQGIQQ